VGLTNTNNTAEELRFYEPSGSGTNYSGFKTGVQISSVIYTWPLADGNGTDYVLCTDGFGNLSWRGFGSTGGGGVDTLWRRGSGTFALEGVGSGNTASGAYAIAAGLDCKASGTVAMCWGGYNLASGNYSVVSGGDHDTASGAYSVIGGGEYSDATGQYSSVGGGSYNLASGTYAAVVGGGNNTASGTYSTVLGGYNVNVSGNYSCAFGQNATVTQDNSFVLYNSAGCRLGIQTQAPNEALDIVGNLRFSGALMPNGLAGTSGYVLQSTGSGVAPIWTAASNLYWSTLGNTGTSSTTNYLGTSDANPLIFRTNNLERIRILSGGNVCVGVTTTTHQFHSAYSGTSDEVAAIFGNATGASSSNQIIGVWGAASNTGATNTGSIGMLGTGNGNTTAGTTNVALQLNDGEFAMGRTTESPGGGTSVEPAAGGTAYSQQGPSGVIPLTLGGGNLSTSAPTAGVFQNLGTLTVNNRYASSTSIVLVSVLQKIDDGSAPDCKQAEYFVDVDNRTSGTFDLRIGMIPTTTSLTNYSTSDKIRIGYTIINAGR